MGIETRAPSRAADPAFREWWSNYLRQGASPGAALTLTQMNAEIDVRNVLPHVRVPTLVLHRSGDRTLLVEEGRYVASLVPGAQFVELPGDDHLPFVGDQDAMLDCIGTFLGSTAHEPLPNRVLATVLWARIQADWADDESRLAFEAHVQREVGWFRGRGLAFSGGNSWRRSTGRLEPSPVRARWPPPVRVSAAPGPSACTPASATSHPANGSAASPSNARAASAVMPPPARCWCRAP